MGPPSGRVVGGASTKTVPLEKRMNSRIRKQIFDKGFGPRNFLRLPLFLSILSLFWVPSRRAHCEEAVSRRVTSYTLQPGWNLLSFPVASGDIALTALKNHNLDAWALDATGPTATERGETVAEIQSHQGYWVWAAETLSFNVEGTQVPRHAGSSTDTQAGWRFLSVAEPTVYEDPNMTQVLVWDAEAQSFERLRVGQWLLPGVGYWAQLVEAAAPLRGHCLPAQWTFFSAAVVVAECPVFDDGSRIIERRAWSQRFPSQSAYPVANKSSIVLRHTQTSSSTSIQAFETEVMTGRAKEDLDAHFVIAPHETGTWEIYEGKMLARGFSDLSNGLGLPETIEVAVMGTYELRDAANYEETQHGFDSDAEEHARQPPREAVLRLTELVAYLARFDSVTTIVSGGPERSSQGTRHLVDALRDRFFSSTTIPSTKNEDALGDVDDRTFRKTPAAPTLVVLQPSEDVVHTESEWVALGGEVFDDALDGLTINGLVVAKESRSFYELISLKPGRNKVQIVATNKNGIKREVVKTFVRTIVRSEPAHVSTSTAADSQGDAPIQEAVLDADPPVVLLKTPKAEVVYTQTSTVHIEGQVLDAHVWDVSVNGLLVAVNEQPFSHEIKLTQALTTVEIVARDAAQNQTTRHIEFILDQEDPKILFSHGHAVTTHEARFSIRGAVSEKNLRSVRLQRPSQDEEVLASPDGFFEAPVSLSEGKNTFFVTAVDRAGNARTETVNILYVADLPVLKRLRAPSQLGATMSGGDVVLWWQSPTLFDDGQALPLGVRPSFRVYRDTVRIKELSGTRYAEEVEDRPNEYNYYVTAVLTNESGDVLESVPSQTISLKSTPVSLLPSSPGEFETPAALTRGGAKEEQPATALSTFGGKTYAHVAFVVNGGEKAESKIRYLQSPEAGKAGSFGPSTTVSVVDPDSRVGDLTVCAREKRVSLAWIEQPKTKSGGVSRLWVVQSRDGGQSFGEARSLRETVDWKRGLDVAYDAKGHHHLVWGEANKIYYLKDLSGSPSNVFDVKKRSPATERVKYLAQYAPQEGKGCACEECWCPESYVLSEEPDPDNNDLPIGPYIYRTETSYIYEPSLHVDDEKISIVGRQRRLWDDKPVPNPVWQAMAEDPIYSDDIVQRLQPTRLVVGWRSVWKSAYEPGDDTGLSEVGHQHQYLYQGRWQESDQIKIAQRPLRPGAWSAADAGGFRQGEWQDDVEMRWRISVVAGGFSADEEDKPSYPEVHAAPDGEMLVSFEKGTSSDPNRPEHNGIYVSHSQNGGTVWSTPERVGSGYVPQLAVASTGEVSVLFYAAGQDASLGQIRAAHKLKGNSFASPAIVNHRPPRVVHWQSHGAEGDSLPGKPSLSAHQELFFAAWVQKGRDTTEADQIVTTRASRVMDFSHLGLAVSENTATGKSVPIKVTAENKFHMQLQVEDTVQISSSQGGGHARGVSEASEPNPIAGSLSSRLSSAGVSTAPVGLRLTQGVGHVVMAGESALASVDASGFPEIHLAASFSSADGLATVSSHTPLVPGNTNGNYGRAIEIRADLLRTETLEKTGEVFHYLVEYQPNELSDEGGAALDQSLFDLPEYRDARHLAGFDRVWAYTQGIALAQLSEADEDYGEQARGIARYLCHHAVRDQNSDTILGWPFSWNTDGDDWRDARLVTGANAWVVQGLGVFVSSSAYRTAPAKDRGRLKACYLSALAGLQDHRRRLAIGTATRATLMTAGWTTEGLLNVQNPHNLVASSERPLGAVFAEIEPSHRFSYYSVLDAIGYDVFSPTSVRMCQSGPGTDCALLSPGAPEWQDYPLEQEAQWTLLKTPALASNVVTEHNLDVLSVLNHALRHQDALAPEGAEARTSWVNELEGWRNELRHGIFYFLWDEDGWKLEFEEALAKLESAPTNQALTKTQSENRAARIRAMDEALVSQSLGRIVTGGQLLVDGSGSAQFKASPHTAIDNCSWLSLSVDYRSLGAAAPEGEEEYTERLGKCLKYTILQYAKDLSFGDDGCDPLQASCPPKKTYRGTHYFQNAFKDPYIEPSELQESSYHLEATMGLILGLFRFVDAHPEHRWSEEFLQVGQNLWAGAQGFVRDHGFAYSSQRIQDLSTRLVSSTALVWYVDVYQYLNRRDGDFDRPLLAYDGLSETARGSSKMVDDALFVFRDVSGDLVASGLTRSEGLPYTLLVDQALAVLVSSNHGNEGLATGYLEGLISILGLGHAVLSDTGLPIDQGRISLQDELLGYYAVAWFLRRFPESPIANQAASILTQDLALFLRDVRLDDSPLSGLLTLPGDATVARLEDNLIAYFVLSAAQEVVEDSEPAASLLSAHLGPMWERLVELCGFHDGSMPARWADEWGVDRSALDGLGALATCSLFASNTGAFETGLRLLEASQALAPAETMYAPPAQAEGEAPEASSPDAAFSRWETHRVELAHHHGVFARRALSLVDPRQDEIARVAGFEDTPKLGGSGLSQALLTLLLDHPSGVFGIHAQPLTSSQVFLNSERFGAEHLDRMKRALADRTIDVLTAMLASDFRAYRFDQFLVELMALQRAHDHVFRVPGSVSREAYLLSTKDMLLHGLCDDAALVHQGSAALNEALGIGCETVMATMTSLFEARGSLGGEEDWVATIQTSNTAPWAMVLERLIEPCPESTAQETDYGVYLGDDCGLRGPEPSSYGFLQGQAPLNLEPDASAIEIRESLRRRLKDALTEGLSLLGPKTPIIYRLGAVDPVHAFNPASADYWKRGALELRFALSSAHKGQVRFELHGLKTEPPNFPLSSTHAANARTFRQWVNAYAGGDLGVLANNAGVPKPLRAAWITSMHRIVRTGVLGVSDAAALLSSLGFEDADAESWKQGYVLSEDPFSEFRAMAHTRLVSLNRTDHWWETKIAYADGRKPIEPVHDVSEDIGPAGLRILVGLVQKMDVMITPLVTDRGDYAVLQDRPQCLFRIENNGDVEARYEVRIDGVLFGDGIQLIGRDSAFGKASPVAMDVCGFVPKTDKREVEVEVKNIVTGEPFGFLFPVRVVAGCQTGETVSSEEASELVATNEWGLRSYQSVDCGDGLMLQPLNPHALGFDLEETNALSALQILRGVRTLKQVVKSTQSVQGAASAGLSAEQIFGIVVGVAGIGSAQQISDELSKEVSGLLWKKLRVFEQPPSGPWEPVGWVPAWDVFAESEAAVRELPIYNRNSEGKWEITAQFFENQIYAVVQPSVYSGPRFPLLDPSVPVFGHDVTSKMAVYRYVGNLNLNLSPQGVQEMPIDNPLAEFLADSGVFPEWIYDFPPEFRYVIYYKLFVEPGLGEGGPSPTYEIGHARPGIYSWSGDEGRFENILFQKQPSIPVELQKPGYVWREWSEEGWHLYGPPDEVDAFLSVAGYTAGAKKTGTTKASPGKKTSNKAPKLKNAKEVVLAPDLRSLDRELSAVAPLLDDYGPAYEFWSVPADLIITLASHFRVWSGLPPIKGAAFDISYKMHLTDLKLRLPEIQAQIRNGSLQMDTKDSFAEVKHGLQEFKIQTEGQALYRGPDLMSRHLRNSVSQAIKAETALVFDRDRQSYILRVDPSAMVFDHALKRFVPKASKPRGAKKEDMPPPPHPDAKPKRQETLHSITFLDASAPFPRVDEFAKSIAVEHWVHSSQTTNFFISGVGGAWQREYTPEGDFVGMKYFVEEELIWLGQNGLLKDSTIRRRVARLLRISEDKDTIAYVGPDQYGPEELWNWMMNTDTVKKHGTSKKTGFNVISILGRTIFIVFPVQTGPTDSPLFSINNYLFEGVATDVQDSTTAKNTAQSHVPAWQNMPWFLVDRVKTKYYRDGEEVLESPVKGPGQVKPQVPSKNKSLPASQSEKELHAGLLKIKALLTKYPDVYGQWPEAARAIVELEPLLLWLQKKTADREKPRAFSGEDMAVYETARDVVLAETSAILDHMGAEFNTTGYDPSVGPIINVQLRPLLNLIGSRMLYQGTSIGGIGNPWATNAKESVVVIWLKDEWKIAVYPIDSVLNRPADSWTFLSAQYFGEPKADFSDVDLWVKDVLAPKAWVPTVWAPSFYVFGHGWVREYLKDGTPVGNTTPVRGYLIHAKAAHADGRPPVAEALGVEPNQITGLSTDQMKEKEFLKLAKRQQEEQLEVAVPSPHGFPLYATVSISAAEAVLPSFEPYVLTRGASHLVDEKPEVAAAQLEEVAKPFVPKNQKMPWKLVTKERTFQSGDDFKALTDPKAIEAALKKKVGPVGMEVLERFPGEDPIVTASKEEITPEGLVDLAKKENAILHLISVNEGEFFVVLSTALGLRHEQVEEKRDAWEERFGDYFYVGAATPQWIGFGHKKDATNVYWMVKKHVRTMQREKFFLAAPDALAPYRLDHMSNGVRGSLDGLNFYLQSKARPTNEEVIDLIYGSKFPVGHSMVFVYSETFGYIVFPLIERFIWDEVVKHDYRILFSLADDIGQKQLGTSRAIHQDYLFVGVPSDKKDALFRTLDGDGLVKKDTRFLEQARFGLDSDVRFPGLVLEAPKSLKLKTSQVMKADTLAPKDFWEQKLNKWFEKVTKGTKIKLTEDLDLTVRGGVPDTARFITNQGPLTLAWNASLEDDDEFIELIELREE